MAVAVAPEARPVAAAQSKLPTIDLFAGAGGLSLGLAEAGFSIEAAVEYEPDAAETWASCHPGISIIDDIGGASLSALRGNIALVAGGPPCQPFSSGGKRLAAEDARDCLPHFLASLTVIEPQAFLLETVPGILAGERGGYFNEILLSARARGFTVTWKVVNAANYGVPQIRRRLVVVGTRDRAFEFPKPTHGPDASQPWVAAGSVVDATAICGEPNPSIVTYARNPDLRPSAFDGHVYNGGGRPIDLSKPCHTLLASAGGNKTHWVDPCDTVGEYHAHLMAGGPPRVGVVPGARRLTVAESALLQTFPRGTRFAGSRSSQYTQVGNAVPPRLAAAIGSALFDHLSEGQ